MAALTPFPFVFVGDGIVEEDSIEWLRQVKLFALSRSESDKLKVFELCLAPGSPAEGWYDSLNPEKLSFKTVCQSFTKAFPGTPYQPLPAWLPLERLETCVLREQDIGRDIMEEGTNLMLPAHVAYARRIQKLAMGVPEPEAQLVANARHRLPPSLKACMPKHIKSWDAYVHGIQQISTYDILKAQERAGGGVGGNAALAYGAGGAAPSLTRHESHRRQSTASTGYAVNPSDLPAPHVVESLTPTDGHFPPTHISSGSEQSPTHSSYNQSTHHSLSRRAAANASGGGYYPSAVHNQAPYERESPSAPPMIQTRSWLQTNERSPQTANGNAARTWVR